MATLNLFRNNSLTNNKQFRENNSKNSLKEICLKYGSITASILMFSFFGLCVLSHQLQINQLSVINLFILAFGVYFSLHKLSPNGKGESIDYFEGFKVGLLTSFIAVGIHTLFIGIYTSIDGTVFSNPEMGVFFQYTNPLTAAGITLFEGIPASIIITYCLMQYFKKD